MCNNVGVRKHTTAESLAVSQSHHTQNAELKVRGEVEMMSAPKAKLPVVLFCNSDMRGKCV